MIMLFKTSSDTTYGSGSYTLSASQDLFITSVTPTPSTQNANASYSVAFTPGNGGTLAVGDTIRLIFPQNTHLPPTMSASDVMGTGQTEPKQIEEVVSALKVVHDYDISHPKELRIFDESQLTDVGNARRLVEYHGKDIHYVSAWRTWMH